ncbi:MAG: hypothetical protein JSS86_25765 [Cyanobacteria bacterium SZAS LIN-2]|nr:hypothetical protein [Cyanobacteria bacterium SZAS LIN-2]
MMNGKALSLLAFSLTLELVLVNVCCQAAISNASMPGSSPYKETVTAALPNGQVDVVKDGRRLSVVVWGRRKLSVRDLKLEALMLATAVGRQYPGAFETVDCLYKETSSPGSSLRLVVKEADLPAYARGEISNLELLSAVAAVSERNPTVGEKYKGLSYRQILDQNSVVAGVCAAERKELCDQLTTLQANGYDVTQATRQFFALEDLVRTGQCASAQLSAAFNRTRQCIAESVAKAQGVSVASSRMTNWQR